MSNGVKAAVCAILLVALVAALLFIGPVHLPPAEVWKALFGYSSNGVASTIVMESRLPMTLAAIGCGATLSVAGLMMQTVFHNPLAGPSVLGISSGASLGVAIFMLSAAGLSSALWLPAFSIAGALFGAFIVMVVLFAFSATLRSAVSLLIVGVMVSYLCSSGISLLNFFSPAEEIRSYLIWGLGSFTSMRLSSSCWLLLLSIMVLLPTFLLVKPLNALLLGERYIESVGYSARSIRAYILAASGLLVAIPTAFCGPIGFIGLIVPHLCRMLLKTSNHRILLPACILFGGTLSIACALLSVLPSAIAPFGSDITGILPINVITPLIGVPVILYLLVRGSRLPYFS